MSEIGHMGQIGQISLQNFRSYEKAEFTFENRNVIIGENGSGKSNLIEAIYLLATGKSFRAERDEEMVRYGEGFFRVVGEIGGLGEIGVTLKEGKSFEVNGVHRRMMDFVGHIRAVMFGPQDMELVTGSPGGRRRYLDFVISQVDREYRRSLVSYEKGLRQRNKLLDLIRDGIAGRNQLFFWDRLLIKNGEYITGKREEYLRDLAEYDKSVISEVRLKQYEVEEVAAGSTLVGPHRDDFIINLDGRDVSKFGSRGEQRMMVWRLKQKEIKYLGGEPVLLLDDIFSELDHKRRDEVMKLVEGYEGQVIVTTADEHLIPEMKDVKVVRL
ncbi:AAA family ATPase [Candidatus Amesbacteria bacterium]|nr:AAA family ATPase [Candidatus Amesbacteria bacterium]